MTTALLEHAYRSIDIGSKSFATASKLFDPHTRRSAVLLYAWCRHCDDVVDGQDHGFALPPALPSQLKSAPPLAGEGWESANHQPAAAPDPRDLASEQIPTPHVGGDWVRAHNPSATQTDSRDPVTPPPTHEERLQHLYTQTHHAYAGEPMESPAFAALQAVAQAHRIPIQLPLAHLDGFAMDVRLQRYRTFDDTLQYCYHVAGVVGLMMARIMGAHDDATLERACDLGLAFQLTNIARDIVDDAVIGRCYLPEAWLEEHGVPREDIAAPAHREALSAIAARLVDAAEPYYHSARQGLAALPLRSAWAVAAAHAVYREIGVRVRQHGARAWDQRISTSKATKARLLVRATGMAIRSRGARVQPRPEGLWRRPAVAIGPV